MKRQHTVFRTAARRLMAVSLSAVMTVSCLGVLPAMAAGAGGTPVDMNALDNSRRDEEMKLAVLFPFIKGDDVVGATLSAYYTMSMDGRSTHIGLENDKDKSTLQWYVGDTRNGTYKKLEGQTGKTLRLTNDHLDKYIRVEVTPKTASATGRALMSDPVGPVMSQADFEKITLKLTKEGTYLEDRDKLTKEIQDRFSNVTYFTVETVINRGDKTPVQHLAGSKYYYKNGVRTAFAGQLPTMEGGKVMVDQSFVTNVLGGTYDFKGAATAALDDVLAANGKKAFYATEEVEKATNGNWRTTAMAEGLVIISEQDTDLGLDIIRDRDVLNEMTNQVYDLHASEEELDWFKDAALGMFIHWDPGTRTGREIGWGRGPGPSKIDSKAPKYDLSYLDFNPTDFDAAAIAKQAKEMGCKYLVFTTKHHAGFCSWDTNYYPEHSIAGSLYAEEKAAADYDIVSQLADACHAEDLKFGLYYSPQDWYNDYCWSEEHYRWMETYMGHLTELMSKYGKIDIFWCDAIGSALTMYHNTSPTGYADQAAWSAWDPRTILRRVKQLQPGIITNDRYAYRWEDPKPWDEGALPEDIRGDYITPEQRTSGFNDKFAWESCLTIDSSNAWSYNGDSGAKSAVSVTRDVIKNCVNGGNVLLNIGLMPNGQFSNRHLESFSRIGAWVLAHGEAIYNTRGGPYKEPSWGGSTFRVEENGSKTIYLHIAPKVNGAAMVKGNSLTIPDPQNGQTYNKASLLDGTPVGLMPTIEGGYVLTLPAGMSFASGSSLEDLDTIIKLETAEMPALTGLTIEPNQVEVFIGKNAPLHIKAEPEGAALPLLNWSSDDETVAKVENGIVTGISEGTATITASTDDGKTATCKVTAVPGNITDYGTNLAVIENMRASSTDSASELEYAVDNDAKTHWSSAHPGAIEHTEWIQADLTVRRPLNRIVLAEPVDAFNCTHVNVLISDDNRNWIKVGAAEGIGEELILDLPEGTIARYVRVEMIMPGGHCARLAEFGIYQSKDSIYKPNTEAEMESFRIGDVEGHVDVNRFVTIEVPSETDLTSLTPEIDISLGAKITPQGAQDFTKDVVYTITSEDGATVKEYTVKMTAGHGYVNGPNLAIGLGDEAYTAISHYSDNTGTNTKPQWAFDGVSAVPDNNYEVWAPENANNIHGWIQVNFGKPVEFNAIELYDRSNNGARVSQVTVQTSNDGEHFDNVDTFTLNAEDAPKVIALNKNVNAQYLRLAEIETSNGRSGPHIVEIEVYKRSMDDSLKMSGIEITTMPNKVSYKSGEVFDPTGMVVTAHYTNGDAIAVNNYHYEPVLGLTADVKEIVINYNGKTAVVPVSVDGSTPVPPPTVDTTVLEKAIEAAEAAKKDVVATDKTAAEVAEGTKFVSTAMDKSLKDAIAVAKQTLAAASSQDEINGVAEALNKVVEMYKASIQIGTLVAAVDTTVLDKAIESAEAAKKNVMVTDKPASEVEEGTKFVSTAADQALKDAIAAAKQAKAEAKTEEAVKAAAEALNKAVAEYEKSCQIGTYAEPTNPSWPDVPIIPHRPNQKPAEKPVLPFYDVTKNDWFYDSVYRAWENDLLNGMTATQFVPDGTLTVAQTIKLAAALHQRDKLGEVTLTNGTEQWYSTYVSYAISNSIIDKSYADYTPARMNAPITRREFVKILHGAKDVYGEMNKVADNAIPDVKITEQNAAEIYDFYRAGILTGSDLEGNFYPETTIKRSEAAAILVRMFDVTARQTVTLR